MRRRHLSLFACYGCYSLLLVNPPPPHPSSHPGEVTRPPQELTLGRLSLATRFLRKGSAPQAHLSVDHRQGTTSSEANLVAVNGAVMLARPPNKRRQGLSRRLTALDIRRHWTIPHPFQRANI